MMSEVSLSRVEQLLLGIACELRPALAVCDPSVSVLDRGHVTLVYLAWLHLVRPAERVGLCDPGVHGSARSRCRCRYVSRSFPVATTATERTRIQLCGRLSVEIDGAQRADALRGKQVPLLLAYLLLNRSRPVGREELIGALWPDDAPISQDAALRTLLSRLRSALGATRCAGATS